jgi:hypothetical protein
VDWKEFISGLVDALAWPVAIGLIVYWVREPLRQRLRQLRRARYRDAELEFDELVDEAEVTLDRAELSRPSPEPPTAEPALFTELATEIASAPRAAVIEAWLAVERELEVLAGHSGIELTGRPWTPEGLAFALARRNVIDTALAAAIVDLHSARNAAAHGRGYTVERDSVVEFVKLAGRARSALRLAGQSRAAAEEGRTQYDLLVYHDLSDPTERTGGATPTVGDDAEKWFGPIGKGLHVVAVAPGFHEGRIAVVLAHGKQPMPALQLRLDRLGLAEQ